MLQMSMKHCWVFLTILTKILLLQLFLKYCHTILVNGKKTGTHSAFKTMLLSYVPS